MSTNSFRVADHPEGGQPTDVYENHSHLILVLTQPCCGNARLSRRESRLGLRRGFLRGLLSMRYRAFTFAYGAMLIVGMSSPAIAKDNGGQQASARHQLPHVHTPQSIDQYLARLTT